MAAYDPGDTMLVVVELIETAHAHPETDVLQRIRDYADASDNPAFVSAVTAMMAITAALQLARNVAASSEQLRQTLEVLTRAAYSD